MNYKADLFNKFNAFIANYAFEEKKKIWQEHSQKFHTFWQNRILNHSAPELNDEEIDGIIRILDRNGKGNRQGAESVAVVWIWQGAWRRLFHQLRDNNSLALSLNDVFIARTDEERANAIDELYKVNQKHKNNLTGENGNGLNALLVAYDPFHNLSMVSLKDRKAFIDYFSVPFAGNLDAMSYGNRMVATNQAIIAWFEELGLDYDARTLSIFCYSDAVQPLWKKKSTETETEAQEETADFAHEEQEGSEEESHHFSLEKQLEDFLIQNWEKTLLGEKYELLEENGELVSQQYKTDIGRIDILARDKKDGRYDVVELKLGRASDVTVGQLTRYMGWLEEHKCRDGRSTKGIIIAAEYDPKIYYSTKKVPDVEVFEYRLKFELVPYVK